MANMLPTRAWAPPMRPPFFRLSRVLRAPKMRVRSAFSLRSASISSALLPASAARAASMQARPMAPLTVWVSMIRTSTSTLLAACWADSMVADRPEARLMHRTVSAPAAACFSKASAKRPGAGADVSGSAAWWASLS